MNTLRFGETVIGGWVPPISDLSPSWKVTPAPDGVGGKAMGLIVMSSMGISVPPGFVIPTGVCMKWVEASDSGKASIRATYLPEFIAEVKELMVRNGDCLVSIRSGARVSMPGMMDTILNVGIHRSNLTDWIFRIGEHAAYDCYRRFLYMVGTVVYGIAPHDFHLKESQLLKQYQVSNVRDLPTDGMLQLVNHGEEQVALAVHGYYASLPPLDTMVADCIEAIWESWNNPRAVEYRIINGYSHDWGTAVTVQAMVFGNLNDKSATGVMFSRDPNTGENLMVGEYMVNAQGEDVVAAVGEAGTHLYYLQEWNIEVFDQLAEWATILEQHYGDMQDIEFTVEDGKLYLLQTRTGKRSARAAFRIAYEMYEEGLIPKEVALSRCNQLQFFQVMNDSIPLKGVPVPSATGIAAGGGVLAGTICMSGVPPHGVQNPILVTKETTPDDIAKINACSGILTATGGLTSHAAVVARGMGKCCVVGVTSMSIHDGGYVTINGVKVGDGQPITIDGDTGRVWVKTTVPVVRGGFTEHQIKLISLAHSGGVAIDILSDPAPGSYAWVPELHINLHDWISCDWEKTIRRLFKAGAPKIRFNVLPLSGEVPTEDIDFLGSLGVSVSSTPNPAFINALATVASDPKFAGATVSVSYPASWGVGIDWGPKVIPLLPVSTVSDLLVDREVSISSKVIDTVFGSEETLNIILSSIKASGWKVAVAKPASYLHSHLKAK